MMSKAVEDFLKAIYALQQQTDRVSTNGLADALNVKAPSVTDMAQRLVDEGLVDYKKYYGVRLTERGEEIALNIIRRHRLIELYLVQELGYELHEVHLEAERLEHAVSDRFVEAIALKLDHPEYDPHGDPIPSSEGIIVRRDLLPLSEVGIATPVTVSRFVATSDEMLQYILERGFKLGSRVEIMSIDPFDGPFTVRIDDTECVIGNNIAAIILVEMIEE